MDAARTDIRSSLAEGAGRTQPTRAQFLTPAGWRGYRMSDFPHESWEVQGEMLHAIPGAKPVSLVTRDTYGDFDLTLEFRLLEGGNSGIFHRVTEDADEPWQTGLEMQLVHDAGHPDGRVPETSCGALYGILPPQEHVRCPPGLLNIARISVRGSRVEHWLNGVRVLAFDIDSPEFRARVAASKFAGLPRFARAKEGHIALQHHGTDAWFNDVRIDVPVS